MEKTQAADSPEKLGQVAGTSHKPELVPRYDTLRAWWKDHHLAHGSRPLIGALIIGGTALTLAAELGALELAVGALTTYAAYRMLRYGVALREALLETIEIEKATREAV